MSFFFLGQTLAMSFLCQSFADESQADMKRKENKKNSENLSERLEKIIERKSNENSALNKLLKKIYEELDDLQPDEDEKIKSND